MPQDKPQLSLSEVSSIAIELNKTSDEFTKVIDDLNRWLQRLNIGIEMYVVVNKWTDPDESTSYEIERLGYTKTKGVWGLVIQETVGDDQSPEPDRIVNSWAFNDAPRDARLRCIDEVPLLVDRLARTAQLTTKSMATKIANTKLLVTALSKLSPVVDAATLSKDADGAKK